MDGRRILWAIDAFGSDPALDLKTAHILRVWMTHFGAKVEPVTVLTPDQLRMPVSFFHGHSDDIVDHVMKELRERMRRLEIIEALDPCVLVSPDVSLRNAVRQVITHAKHVSADLVVCSSHSEKAVSHFLFGSFAETLVQYAEVPVFIVTPHSDEIKQVDRILFPTDISDLSRMAFETVLPVARSWGARLTLFHKLEYLSGHSFPAYEESAGYAQYHDDETIRRKTELETWAAQGRAAGVTVDIQLDEGSGTAVWKSIVAEATREHAGIVAMASETGPVASAILGSTIRQIIRDARCPLWVMHPSR